MSRPFEKYDKWNYLSDCVQAKLYLLKQDRGRPFYLYFEEPISKSELKNKNQILNTRTGTEKIINIPNPGVILIRFVYII